MYKKCCYIWTQMEFYFFAINWTMVLFNTIMLLHSSITVWAVAQSWLNFSSWTLSCIVPTVSLWATFVNKRCVFSATHDWSHNFFSHMAVFRGIYGTEDPNLIPLSSSFQIHLVFIDWEGELVILMYFMEFDCYCKYLYTSIMPCNIRIN